MIKMWKNLNRKKKIITGIITGVILVFVISLFIVLSLLTKKSDIKEVFESLSSYQAVLEVKNNKEEIASARYKTDSKSNIAYFSLIGKGEDVEKQFYDKNNKLLYYKNILTNQYNEMELDQDMTLVSSLRDILVLKNETGFFSPNKYVLSKDKMDDMMQDGSNLLFTYLASVGYQVSKDGELIVDATGKKLNKITIVIPTTTEELTLTIVFLELQDEVKLPSELTSIIPSELKTSVEWTILYLQRLYAEETQVTKPVTDILYLLDSKYEEEIKEKLVPLPIEIRIRIEPSTNKETGLITGTITYEGDIVINIENSRIIS